MTQALLRSMRITAEPAFVLHARPWRETSLIVELLSRHHGRIGLVARGVTSAKRHATRAALQPLQHVALDAVLRGELGQLRAVEAVDTAPRLSGAALASGFYLNELVMRLSPRFDPLPDLYMAYGRTRAALGSAIPLAWALRCFERDLLEALGIGFDLACDGAGAAIDPHGWYALDPEYGPRRLAATAPRRRAASGRALLALATDVLPEAADLATLRLPLRQVLVHHLGSDGLKSWEILTHLMRPHSVR